MKIQDLVKFFGLPAQNLAFDKFLTEYGISERPVFDVESGNPFEIITLEAQGFMLQFDQPDDYEKQYGNPREAGEMIFSKIFLYIVAEEGFKPYSGEVLPGISSDITREKALAEFGSPSRTRDEGDRFGRPNNIEYTWNNVNGLGVFIRFIKDPPAARHIVISPEKI
ncbi:hypothetical protein GCM10027093_54780 [Paraburkholderia jirisanensis]